MTEREFQFLFSSPVMETIRTILLLESHLMVVVIEGIAQEKASSLDGSRQSIP